LFIVYYFCVNDARFDGLKDIDNLTFIVRLRGSGKAKGSDIYLNSTI
jgi:hypothetical protein